MIFFLGIVAAGNSRIALQIEYGIFSQKIREKILFMSWVCSYWRAADRVPNIQDLFYHKGNDVYSKMIQIDITYSEISHD